MDESKNAKSQTFSGRKRAHVPVHVKPYRYMSSYTGTHVGKRGSGQHVPVHVEHVPVHVVPAAPV